MKASILWAMLLLAPAAARADVVYIRGAGQISGRIVEQTDQVVKVDTGDGILGVPAANVERIEKARSPLDDYDERAAKLAPNDVNGWRSLGKFAAQKGITAQSRAAYRKVLDVSPNDAEAREALGFVQHNGKWMTEEESYQARGYVKHEGEWMTQAAAQQAQANDQARRDAERRAVDAEIAASEAKQRADEAEKRAKEAEEEARRNQYNYPLYWGNWGYGMTYWPSNSGWNISPTYGKPITRPSAPVRGNR